MEEVTASRWRRVTFWVLAVLLLTVLLGDPEYIDSLWWIVTVWGGVSGEMATHEVHMIAESAVKWALAAAVVANVHRPERQAGSAWQLCLPTVLLMGSYLLWAEMDSEMAVILTAVTVAAVLTFAVHPSPWGDRLRSTSSPSLPLGVLTAVAAVPLLTYGIGQYRIHLASSLADPHYEMGHWILMGAYAFGILLLAGLSTLRVSGWRLNAWTAGVLAALLGLASLAVSAPSALASPWALLAIAWGTAFIVIAEVAIRRPVNGNDDLLSPPVGAIQQDPSGQGQQ
jgi:hypothetical protein